MVVQLIMPSKIVFMLLFLCSCEMPILKQEKLSDYQQRNQQIAVAGQYITALSVYVQFEWKEGPYGSPVWESIFELRILDSQGELISLEPDIEIFHYGWMPFMGHGSADDGLLQEIESGIYLSEDFYFNMPGLWDMHFIFKRQGVKLHEVVFRFTF